MAYTLLQNLVHFPNCHFTNFIIYIQPDEEGPSNPDLEFSVPSPPINGVKCPLAIDGVECVPLSLQNVCDLYGGTSTPDLMG